MSHTLFLSTVARSIVPHGTSPYPRDRNIAAVRQGPPNDRPAGLRPGIPENEERR